MTPTVLITRPAPNNAVFADRLRNALGCKMDLILSPLLEIHPIDADLGSLDVLDRLIFTSQNGVEAYARLTHKRDIPAICVGDATAAYAQSLGISAHSVQGSNQDIIDLARTQPAQSFLHIRGEHSIGNLAQALIDIGWQGRDLVAYGQCALDLNHDATKALEREFPIIVPLFSPRSAALFFKKISANSNLLIATLSPAIASKVPKAHLDQTHIANGPNMDAMADLVQKLIRTL